MREHLVAIVGGIILSTFITISLVLIVRGIELQNVNLGWILAGFIVAYLIFSFTIVNVGEVAMLTIWGTPINDLEPGWYFTPAGIVSIRKEKGTVFQDELPAEPENIYRGEALPPPGKFPPIRIKFGPPMVNPVDPIDVAMIGAPYNVEMVAEVVPVIAWQITKATTFFDVIGDVANCRKMLADKAVQTFGDDFAKVTPAKASLTLGETSLKMKEQLEKITDTWGIKIQDGYVKPFIYSHGLNEAVEGVSKADQEAKAAIKKADGEAQAVERTARAEKSRLIQVGLAKTDASGNIIELLPDANTRVNADAIKALAGVKGTLVLGRDTTPVINIQKGEQ